MQIHAENFHKIYAVTLQLYICGQLWQFILKTMKLYSIVEKLHKTCWNIAHKTQVGMGVGVEELPMVYTGRWNIESFWTRHHDEIFHRRRWWGHSQTWVEHSQDVGGGIPNRLHRMVGCLAIFARYHKLNCRTILQICTRHHVEIRQ